MTRLRPRLDLAGRRTSFKIPSRSPAGGGGRRLWLLFFRLLNFFFLTAISFGHIELLVIVEPQLRWFLRVLQPKILLGPRQRRIWTPFLISPSPARHERGEGRLVRPTTLLSPTLSSLRGRRGSQLPEIKKPCQAVTNALASHRHFLLSSFISPASRFNLSGTNRSAKPAMKAQSSSLAMSNVACGS